MTMTTTYAGMDAHARTIHVAVLAPGAEQPGEWQLANEPRGVKRLAQRLKDGRNWTLRHRRWLLTLRFEQPAAQATFDDYLRALEGVEERLRTLEQELAACAASDDYREAVGLLWCFRGVDTVTAMTVLAELGDVTRFGSARQLMSYLGLTPSEYR